MASVVLSQDLNSGVDGLNLKWAVSNMQALKEITMVYYKNSADADIQSLDIDPSNVRLNLNLESGASYSFQLQVVDTDDVTVYSNTLVLDAPYVLSAPELDSFVGADNAVTIKLKSTLNLLSSADTVEFVFKKGNNSVFWIIKPFSASGFYNLSNFDNANLINNQSYRVACMFQPASSNTLYTSPSSMSNSLTVTPTNYPNGARNVQIRSVGSEKLDLRVQWLRPTDFNEWSDSFTIKLELTRSPNVVEVVELTDQNIVEYTWFDLGRGAPFAYNASIQYVNRFGEGPKVYGAAVTLMSIPDAPSLSIEAGDQEAFITIQPAAFDGQAAFNGYNIYRNGIIHAYVTDTGPHKIAELSNGVQYSFTVSGLNTVGESEQSAPATVRPFGSMSITSVNVINKTITVNMQPNGKPIQRIIMVAVDADPSVDDGSLIYDVPLNQISQSLTGNVQYSKTFSSFSSNISLWAVIANNDVNSDFRKFE